MAELKVPTNYMELSLGSESPAMGDPPIRMLFSEVGEEPTTAETAKQQTLGGQYAPTQYAPVDPFAVLSQLCLRLDTITVEVDNLKLEIERLKQPWYRRLWNWVRTWIS